jgi:deoxycytidylate deaminase
MNRGKVDVFDKVILLAKKSPMLHKHGAVIIWNGEVLGQGFNHQSSYMSHSWSCHAEVAAILSVRSAEKWKMLDATLIVVRVGNDGNVKLSRPCENCTKQIQKCGIKKVFYST